MGALTVLQLALDRPDLLTLGVAMGCAARGWEGWLGDYMGAEVELRRRAGRLEGRFSTIHYAAMLYPAEVLGDPELWAIAQEILSGEFEDDNETSLIGHGRPASTSTWSTAYPGARFRCTSSRSTRTCKRRHSTAGRSPSSPHRRNSTASPAWAIARSTAIAMTPSTEESGRSWSSAPRERARLHNRRDRWRPATRALVGAVERIPGDRAPRHAELSPRPPRPSRGRPARRRPSDQLRPARLWRVAGATRARRGGGRRRRGIDRGRARARRLRRLRRLGWWSARTGLRCTARRSRDARRRVGLHRAGRRSSARLVRGHASAEHPRVPGGPGGRRRSNPSCDRMSRRC